MIAEANKCGKCKGKKVMPERKVVEVHIERGMKHGSRVVFRGEAGDEPGAEPGDLIFVVQQKPHAVFKRDGNDLFIEREIPLVDALAGVQFTLTHLDKRRLRIASGKSEVISPGTFKCVDGAGMPIPGTGGMRYGDLYIKFTITFPASGTLSQGQLSAVRAALPAGPREKVNASNSTTTSGGVGSLKPGDIVEEVYGSKPAPTSSSASSSSSSSSNGKGGKSGGSTPKTTSSKKGGAAATSSMEVEDGVSIDHDSADASEHIPKGREGEVEDVVMSDVSAESRAERVKAQQASHGSGGEAYEEDEEESGGARRVACAQQ
jgi:DnaJ C terminal domain